MTMVENFEGTRLITRSNLVSSLDEIKPFFEVEVFLAVIVESTTTSWNFPVVVLVISINSKRKSNSNCVDTSFPVFSAFEVFLDYEF